MKIVVRDLLKHNSLVTREVVSILHDKIIGCKSDVVELDFADVSFISRSFADEFHKMQLTLDAKMDIKIIVVNAQNDILQMLEAVKRTQNANERSGQHFAHLKFDSRRSLKDFLFSI